MLLLAAHPVQAVLFAVAVGVLAGYSDRSVRESAVAAVAVLLVQLAAGLLNDVCDAPLDRRGKVSGKPIAAGDLPRGNATYVIAVLLLLALPAALQNGTLAGVALLATVPVAYVHDRILHRTAFSWLGWAATFALLCVFLAYGGWGGGRHGDTPTWQFAAISAVLGVCVHFLTTLPDLVDDNRSGVRNLPLRIALRTGAPRLLLATLVVSLLALAGWVVIGLDPGLRAW
jgi:4-hydroxybenzoate polyprenyltransferase